MPLRRHAVKSAVLADDISPTDMIGRQYLHWINAIRLKDLDAMQSVLIKAGKDEKNMLLNGRFRWGLPDHRVKVSKRVAKKEKGRGKSLMVRVSRHINI